MKRAAVTGVAGFIGSHLADRLLDDGVEVLGIDGFTDTYSRAEKESNLESARRSPRFTLLEGELEALPLEENLAGADVVFHCAARAGVRTSWGSDFRHYVRDNVLATQRLLDAVRDTGVQRFVYTSSSSVYGDAQRLPVTELDPVAPISPYGATKLSGEHLARIYHAAYGVPVVSLRLFTVYGPRQRPDMAFRRFFDAIQSGRVIEVFGDGRQTRDFTYVADVVSALLAAATAPDVAGEVLNIAGGTRLVLRDVLDAMGELAGVAPRIEYGAHGRGEAHHTFASIDKAARRLGYRPATEIRAGLRAELEWIRSRSSAGGIGRGRAR